MCAETSFSQLLTACSGIFLEFCHSHGLNQYVTSPTRSDNILDLVSCNDYKCVQNISIFEPFSTSDHSQVRFNVLLDMPRCRPSRSYPVHDFSWADWSQIKLFLNEVDFYEVFNNELPAHDIIINFYDIIHDCMARYVPVSRRSFRTKSRSLIISARKSILRKSQAWRTYRTFRIPESLALYRKAASDCKTAIYSFISNYENNLISTGNLGAFYRP
jgi:hypothetical protein